MKKQISYIMSLVVTIILLLLPVGFFIAYEMTGEQRWLVATAITGLLAVITYKPISEWRYHSRTAAQSDEFGNSIRKQYDRLSQKERDAIDFQKTMDAERIIGGAALKKLTHHGSDNPQYDLDNLIGLRTVKQKIQEMAAKMEFENQEKKRKGKKYTPSFDSGHHAVYFGSPGTGKTTVARIMTGFLYKYGYIPENKIVEVDGNFLKAGAETATKTTMVIRKAFGGVLFVDEAYSLVQGDKYGLDAIATLIKQMEDNRDKFVLILAGYTNEMRMLLEANPGFESRIKEYLYFDDYDDNDMVTIFKHMAQSKGYSISPDGEANLRLRISAERELKSFGNARTARSILDEAIEKHAYHFIANHLQEAQRYMLTSDDVSTQPRTI